jgi:hypothetical protein
MDRPIPVITAPEELNRILTLVRDHASPHGLDSQVLVDIAASSTFNANLPSHQLTIAAALAIGLLDNVKGKLRITAKGEDFLSLNPRETYELAPGQARYLVEHCIVIGPYKMEASTLLKKGVRDARSRRIWIDPARQPLGVRERALLALLRRLGFLVWRSSVFDIAPEYLYIATSLTARKLVSLAELERLLNERAESGSRAEAWVLEFEKQRLQAAGCPIEAEAVTIISNLDVCAGYDIESFDGPNSALLPDRFIEVKSTTADEFAFFWSDNELETARSLDLHYWIYHLRTFDDKNGAGKLFMMQDPARLFKSGKLALKAATYHATFAQK